MAIIGRITSLVVSFTCIALSVTSLCLAAESKPIDLKIAMWVGASHAGGICAKQWSDELEKRTQGRIKVTYYYSEALGKANTYADLLASGGTDAATLVSTYFPGRFPLLEVMNLPFLWPNGDVANKVFYELYDKGYFTKELAKFKLLYLGTTAPYDIISKTTLRTPAEAQGKRLRSAGGPWTATIKEWGAVPVTIPAAEIYPALERGILDGVVQGVAPVFNLKLPEVAKFINLNHIGSASIVFAMNLEFFDKLPPEVKAVIEDLLIRDRTAPAQGRIFDEEVVKAVEQLPAMGVTIHRPTPGEVDQWRKSVQPVIDRWVEETDKKGLPGKKLIDDLKVSANKQGVTF